MEEGECQLKKKREKKKTEKLDRTGWIKYPITGLTEQTGNRWRGMIKYRQSKVGEYEEYNGEWGVIMVSVL